MSDLGKWRHKWTIRRVNNPEALTRSPYWEPVRWYIWRATNGIFYQQGRTFEECCKLTQQRAYLTDSARAYVEQQYGLPAEQLI